MAFDALRDLCWSPFTQTQQNQMFGSPILSAMMAFRCFG
jgi:hypothetical protein